MGGGGVVGGIMRVEKENTRRGVGRGECGSRVVPVGVGWS